MVLNVNKLNTVSGPLRKIKALKYLRGVVYSKHSSPSSPVIPINWELNFLVCRQQQMAFQLERRIDAASDQCCYGTLCGVLCSR